MIDADGGPRRFGECLDPWQRDDFAALDPGWKRVCGQNAPEGRQRAYLERSRGHSKTADLAVMATWALFASKRRLSGIAASGDREQAGYLRNAIDKLVSVNPWLRKYLEVQRDRVVNLHTGSELAIIASDAATSYGLTPDFVLIDEVTHWATRDLWDSLISAAAKRARCLVCVIANAGWHDSWQWGTREAIRTDPDWYFSRLDGPVASWIKAKHLAEQQRLLPALVYDRLWLNRWAPGAGDALREDDIRAALTLDGPLAAAETGWRYALGLDLGLRRDASAAALVGVNVGYGVATAAPKLEPIDAMQELLFDCGLADRPAKLASAAGDTLYRWNAGDGRLKLCDLHVWQPPKKGGKVQIEPIETAIRELYARFGCVVSYDVSQAEYLSERLSKSGVPTQAVDPTSTNMRGMAAVTLEAFNQQLLSLYPQEQLLADLRALRVTEKSYGIRLTSPRGPSGHGDSATALSLALLAAKRLVVSAARNTHRPILAEAVCF
ncbi:MAG TPA: terminase large subunit [Pirellulales bacterium]|nr:terminase large subunit [Pirellulales bacterium]